jgi:hypothetical protein
MPGGNERLQRIKLLERNSKLERVLCAQKRMHICCFLTLGNYDRILPVTLI